MDIGFEIEYFRPPRLKTLEEIKSFLGELGLGWEPGIEFTVNLREKGCILASGSREGKVLKCIGVGKDSRGEGLTAVIVTELVKDALAQGFPRCFLFTKPENIDRFTGMGFYPVAGTTDAALLENRRNGVRSFVDSLGGIGTAGKSNAGEKRGAVVAHCNPFTRGHQYLIEQAAQHCGELDLFILSEGGGEFSPATRMELARRGTAHLPNVQVHPGGDYLISSITFPEYFITRRDRLPEIHAELDIAIFVQYFAGPRSISRRFIGSEPLSRLTAAYNKRLHEILPGYGIDVIEIPRLEEAGAPISASRVRELLHQNKLKEVRPLVPDSTFEYLEKNFSFKTGNE
jgi:[citrate (pro-3S)-lyase] ligase